MIIFWNLFFPIFGLVYFIYFFSLDINSSNTFSPKNLDTFDIFLEVFKLKKLDLLMLSCFVVVVSRAVFELKDFSNLDELFGFKSIKKKLVSFFFLANLSSLVNEVGHVILFYLSSKILIFINYVVFSLKVNCLIFLRIDVLLWKFMDPVRFKPKEVIICEFLLLEFDCGWSVFFDLLNSGEPV